MNSNWRVWVGFGLVLTIKCQPFQFAGGYGGGRGGYGGDGYNGFGGDGMFTKGNLFKFIFLVIPFV